MIRLFSSQPKKPSIRFAAWLKGISLYQPSKTFTEISCSFIQCISGALSLGESNRVVRQNNHFYTSLGLRVRVAMPSPHVFIAVPSFTESLLCYFLHDIWEKFYRVCKDNSYINNCTPANRNLHRMLRWQHTIWI